MSITILVFILHYFQEKCQNFSKIPKALFWGNFGPFSPKFGQKWIFLAKRVLLDFKYSKKKNNK